MATGMRAGRMVRKILLVAAALTVAGLFAAPAAKASASCSNCYPPGATGCKGTLTTSSSTVNPGGTITVSGGGYAPGATVTLNVCNIETITTKANAQGQISVPTTFPANARLGACLITAVGVGACGETLSLSVTVTVVSSTVVPPTKTGEPWAGWPYWALAAGAALAGFSLVVAGRRRRPQSAG